MTAEDIDDAIAQRVGDAALDLTAQLVELDTVNPGLAPGRPGERAAVQLLADRLAGAGFRVEIVEAAMPDRPSLVARRRGRAGGRSLLLNGHLDTVPPGGMPEPFRARLDGDRRTGRLLGRGTCDMKAGVAAMVVAAEEAVTRGIDGEVVLALVADEENASVGTEAVLGHLTARGDLPDACLVGEPTGLDLVVAHRGFAVVEVTLRGRAAHSSMPAEGTNAVTHLGRLLAEVERADRELAAGRSHPHAGPGSLMVTVAHGGSAPFSLPASATATVERRTMPGESSADALSEVQQIVAGLGAEDPTVAATCVLTLAREAWEADLSDAATTRLLDLLARSLPSAGWSRPVEAGAPAWMESALWQAAGVPTLVCGPAGGGMHSDDEWVDVAQLRAYAVALARLVPQFCSTAED